MANERDYENDWQDWMNAGQPEHQGIPSAPQFPQQGIPIVPPSSDVPTPTGPPPPTTTGGRNPNAGPDGSNTPNMDPPGLMGGYWMNGQWVNGSPRTPGIDNTNPGNPFGDLGPEPMPGSWNWPVFNAPRAPNIDPFVFEKFEQPSLEDAQNEPGYQFAATQGRKMLENSAAARGVLRSGGTLKNILEYGNQFGEQNYQNVFNRKKDVFQTNEGNRFNAFNQNTANTFGTFDRNYKGAWDEFTPQFDASKMEFQDVYNRWRDKLNALTQLSQPPG